MTIRVLTTSWASAKTLTMLRRAPRKIVSVWQCCAPKEHTQKRTPCKFLSILHAFLLLSALVRTIHELVAVVLFATTVQSLVHKNHTSTVHPICVGWRQFQPTRLRPRSPGPIRAISPQTCQPHKNQNLGGKSFETLSKL